MYEAYVIDAYVPDAYEWWDFYIYLNPTTKSNILNKVADYIDI
jgi:hypothetical protein